MTEFAPQMAHSEAIRVIAEHAPIGVLTLAAVIENHGYEPVVVDLNREYYDFLSTGHRTDFCEFAVARLGAQKADVYGLSTICSSYPLTIRMAQRLRELNPSAAIVLGGPQSSVVHRQTMEAFSSIDYVLRGEADETFPELLECIQKDSGFERVPGLTFRGPLMLTANASAPVVKDLDALPLPAFHLYDLSTCRYVPLELGRGCPFACEFCSTNDFFRRNFRLKSPDKVLAQMRQIHQQYGIYVFDLIHDMFTVDRKRVLDFCDAMLEAPETFFWNCSARTDCIDDELIRYMAKAGCRGIFFGIETGSQRMQKLINKNLDLSEVLPRLACTNRYGIRTAFSLITCFPDETIADFEDTASLLVEALRYDYSEPQLHLLAPLAETPIHRRFKDELVLDKIFSDMSHQGWEQDSGDQELIEKYADIFPNFYAVPTPLDRMYVKRFRDFILNAMSRFRWLVVALSDFVGDIQVIFRDWERWLSENNKGIDNWSKYYGNVGFRSDFLAFCGRYSAARPTLIDTLIEYERLLDRMGVAEVGNTSSEQTYRHEDSLPAALPGVRVAGFPFDYLRIIKSLRMKRAPRHPRPRQVFLAIKQSRADGRVETIQLTEAAATLLYLCDGRRSVADIARDYAGRPTDLDGIPAETACRFGLEYLRLQGLINTAAA